MAWAGRDCRGGDTPGRAPATDGAACRSYREDMPSTRRLCRVAVCAAALTTTALTGTAPAYVGGHDATGDKPFVSGLRLTGTSAFFCTGTLITPTHVLTAAHCVDGTRTAAQVEVVVGDTDLRNANDPAEVRRASRLVLHPKWSGKIGSANDVAVVELVAPSTIAPARLGVTPALKAGIERCVRLVRSASPEHRYLVERACPSGRGKALGWGRRSMSASGASPTLREVTPTIFGGPRRTFWRVKAGACPGDSGGPLLVLAADGSPRQIGVASYNQHGGGTFDFLIGDRCSAKSHDFYSDVSAGALRTWVESITQVRDHRR